MTEHITYRLFLLCLFSCATLVLIMIWLNQDGALPAYYFQTTGTFFVIGLGSFLIWLTLTLQRIRASRDKAE